MTQEFTATRTMLANAMATAGAELLAYMKTAGALAAIPDTDPQQYVVAGTLEIIGKLLPAVAPAVQAQAELTDERILEIYRQLRAQVAENEDPVTAIDIARAIEQEVCSAAREQARNEALTDAIEEIARVGCEWIDDSNRNSVAPLLNEAIARIRKLMAEAPAASKEGDAS